jgi:hypothetical protein
MSFGIIWYIALSRGADFQRDAAHVHATEGVLVMGGGLWEGELTPLPMKIVRAAKI